MAVPVDTFFLDPESHGTLQARIQEMVAGAILSGRLTAGEKLPSSRKLAQHLSVSRITVTLAYAELVANDYLTARGRSGYFVSETAPPPPEIAPAPRDRDAVNWRAAIAKRFSGAPEIQRPADWARFRYPFIYGQADPALFDHSSWRLCAVRALGQKDFAALTADQYDADDPSLATFIARHTLPRRGIAARPQEILVTLGAQNALWLAAAVLLGKGRHATIEDPCYPALRHIVERSGAGMTGIAVDADGLPPDALPGDTDVIFTTPSHQCPTNATMPLESRRALLARARDIGAILVEDDYEFEISFLKPPYPALKSLDRDGRVVYVGSFSKSLFPGLRLGYLVGSEPFIREARALRALVLRHPPGLMQRTAAHFLSLGHYDAMIGRLGRAFKERRQAMEAAMAEAGLSVAGRGAFGGSSFWMEAPYGVRAEDLARRLAEEDVLIEPGDAFFGDEAPPARHYRLAYSSISAERIPEGIARIGRAVAAA